MDIMVGSTDDAASFRAETVSFINASLERRAVCGVDSVRILSEWIC